MTISSESVIIYVNGKPEIYTINEFRRLYKNYKALITIPSFKYWNRSKIFKLWLKYVQRQRRKKNEKKLKERLRILDRPIVEGIKKIRKILEEIIDINIFRLNSRTAKFPNQFILDYHYQIVTINKEFDFIRSRMKEIVKDMCDKEVQHFLASKKMPIDEGKKEENKLNINPVEKIMNNENKNNEDNKDNINNNDINNNEINNDFNNPTDNNDKINIKNKDQSFNYNYKLNKHREILKNINIPDDLYKNRISWISTISMG